VRLSPNGRYVAARTETGLTVLDADTGTQKLLIRGNSEAPCFSPDSRFVALDAYGPGVPIWLDPKDKERAQFEGIVLHELVTGKEVLQIPLEQEVFLAWSPDGRVLAGADGEGLKFWDAATGKELHEYARPPECSGSKDYFVASNYPFASLAFLPNHRALATGLGDSTILLWDTTPALRNLKTSARALDNKQIDDSWGDLGSDDAGKAYRAMHSMAQPKSIPFLRDHLQPVPAADVKRAEKLIGDLDSEQFELRGAATKELTKLAEQFEPLLLRSLENNPSEEVKRRIATILASPYVPPSGERLRTLRAIAILERIGTPEAQDILRKLAGGGDAARETREARESLERLERRARALGRVNVSAP